MKILPFGADEVSPGIGSLQTPISWKPMSSRAQPVTAIAPVTPVVLLTGVSTRPVGAPPELVTRSVTGIVSGEFGTFAAVTTMVAVCVDTGWLALVNDTENVPAPVPDPPVIWSQLAAVDAVQVDEPLLKVTATVCAPLRAPPAIAPIDSDVRFTATRVFSFGPSGPGAGFVGGVGVGCVPGFGFGMVGSGVVFGVPLTTL